MKSKKFIAIFIAILSILYLFSGCGDSNSNSNSGKNGQKSLKNTVVFLTFETQGDNFPEGFSESIYQMYETAPHSVKNYLLKQSKSRLLMQTQILPSVDGAIILSSKPVEYYKPRYKWINGGYSEINEQGYDNRYFNQSRQAVRPNSPNSLAHIDGVYREQSLIREIISKIDLPSDYEGDLNGDEILDSLVIITDCEVTGEWGDILWPHAGVCYDFSSSQVITNYFTPNAEKYKELGSAKLGGLNARYYNVLTASAITAKKAGDDCTALSKEESELYNVGLLAHESLHLLGLADYYSYESSKYESVGEFDIMGNTQSLPQNMLAYTRLKLGWLDTEDVLYINQSGSYTLPLSMADGKVAAKIILSDYYERGEYFMMELRSASLATADCAYDGGLYGDGLIIYRVAYENAFINSLGGVSSQELGNMYGADEVYVFRAGNPQKAKKLSDPLKVFSYAMLANDKSGLTLDLSYYRYDSYGNSDKNKNTSNLVSSLTSPSETIISYSDGSNSGIVIKDVTLHKETQTVTFTVELPENENGQNSQNFNNVIAKRLPNGAPHVRWQYNNEYKRVSVMAIRSTKRLKEKAESNSLDLKKVFLKAESSFLYNLLELKSETAKECTLTLDAIESEALVILCIEKKNGERSYIYAGSVPDDNLTFNEYLFSVFDAVYVIVFISAFILVVVGFVLLIVVKAKAKPEKRQ